MMHDILKILFILMDAVISDAPATGNFGISTSSCFFANALYNPPQFSTYLAEAGRGASLDVSLDGAPPVPLSSLFSSSPAPVFPECSFSVALSPGVVLRWRAFAPLSPVDAEAGFLPLLLGSLSLDVAPHAPPFTRNATLMYRFFCGADEGARAACGGGGGVYAWLPPPLLGAVNFSAGALFVGASGGAASGADCSPPAPGDAPATLCARLAVVAEPWGGASFGAGLIFVGHHLPAGRYAAAFPAPLDLAVHGVVHAARLAAHHAALLASFPNSGWPAVDAGVRSWLQAPALLTKGIGERVLTMGYVELNARDSYWTTAGLHAAFWPSLEALMLRESCEFACSPGGGPPSYCAPGDAGKIPTCVLPTIVRDDNVDITAFWALRLGRYVAATSDEALLGELYPCLRGALHYLQRRAAPGEALPAARAESYWGSWLDVPFMKGRKLMADNSAVYLAAQRVGARAAALLASRRAGGTLRGGQSAAANGTAGTALSTSALRADGRNFSAAYAAGWRQLISPVEVGGQWNATTGALSDTWWDGRVVNYTLGDQFMAVYFSLLGHQKAASLLEWLTGGSGLEGPYGVRALFPYMPHASDPWGGEYPPGVYANGGSYAWLTCGAVHALAAGGDVMGAWRVWLKLTTRMFEAGAGGLAFEYLHSDTGARMGNAPQGWDGVCAAWAWRGGVVGWWRESTVGDVGARGGAPGEEDPADVGTPLALNEPGLAHPHVYHLSLPPLEALGSGARAPRAPLLLPLLSLRNGSFARCAFPAAGGGWGAPPAACHVVAGILEEAGGAITWDSERPCKREEAGFRCAAEGDEEVRIILD